jgi:hypothetical protein
MNNDNAAFMTEDAPKYLNEAISNQPKEQWGSILMRSDDGVFHFEEPYLWTLSIV